MKVEASAGFLGVHKKRYLGRDDQKKSTPSCGSASSHTVFHCTEECPEVLTVLKLLRDLWRPGVMTEGKVVCPVAWELR